MLVNTIYMKADSPTSHARQPARHQHRVRRLYVLMCDKLGQNRLNKSPPKKEQTMDSLCRPCQAGPKGL